MASPNNLPQQLTSFVGRELEIAEVKRLLAGARLLTLTGTGGCGKTRLALRVATGSLEEYRDGVWFVDLAPLSDPSLVPQAVAFALGVSEKHARPLIDVLSEYLASRHLLLVLDNCEQVLDACVALADSLLRASPELQILATSRHVLGVSGEATWRVPPLSLPDGVHLPDVVGLLQYEAIQLFVERARLKRPGFEVTLQNAVYIVQLCRHLDGIPLAIELAAARMSVLALEQVVNRLDERFRLLTDGMGSALPRQQTLRAAIDWSYDLLNEPEQMLLRRLSIFSGSFSLEAVEGICGLDVDEYETISLLSRMVDKSLVMMEERDGEARYRVLETIRQYAWEKLYGSDEMAQMRTRHLQWYTELAEGTLPELQGRDQKLWLDRLEADHDNMRAALARSQIVEDGADWGMRLAIALWQFWYVRGYLSEGRRWMEIALARSDGAPPALKAQALSKAGLIAMDLGDYAQATTLLADALSLFRSSDDKPGLAACCNYLGVLADSQGDYERAISLYEESLAFHQALGDKRSIAVCLNNIGYVTGIQGNYKQARHLHEQSLSMLRELENWHLVTIALKNLGQLARIAGEYDAARTYYQESLDIRNRLRDRIGIADCLLGLAEVAWCLGDDEAAQRYSEQSLALYKEIGDKDGIAPVLMNLGQIERCRGNHKEAMQFLEEALRVARDVGSSSMISSVLHRMGQIKRQQHEHKAATAFFTESLQVARQSGIKAIIAQDLIGLAEVLRAYRQPDVAMKLLGAAHITLQETGYHLAPVDLAAFDQALLEGRLRVDRQPGAQLWAEGQAMSLDEAAVLAVDTVSLLDLTTPLQEVKTSTGEKYPAGLTRREVEVLRLIAEGLSNEQVAERLFLSSHTVRAHLHSIYGKIDVTGRAAAARYALEHNMVY